MNKTTRFFCICMLLCSLLFSLCACRFSTVASELAAYQLELPETKPTAPTEPVTEPTTEPQSVTPPQPATISIAGTYVFHEMSKGDQVISRELMELALGQQDMNLDDSFYIIINDNGTAVFYLEGERTNMFYQDGHMWPADDPSDKASFRFENGHLTFSLDEITLSMRRDDTGSATPAPSPSTIAGEYLIYSISDGSFTLYTDDLEPVLSSYYDLELRELLCLKLNEDGSGHLTGLDPETNEKLEAEMEWDETHIWTKDDPTDRIAFTYTDNKITLVSEGVTLTLQKTVLSL